MLPSSAAMSRIKFAMAEPQVLEPRIEPVLPSLVLDYLDTLLQTGTEFPERQASRFMTLHFVSGGHDLLTPIARIKRIEQLSVTDRFYRVKIPECEGKASLRLTLQDQEQCLCVDRVLDIFEVEHDMVEWRNLEKRAPWFVGTHKQMLCRIFDPDLLIRQLPLAN